jgi:hypothetical protein
MMVLVVVALSFQVLVLLGSFSVPISSKYTSIFSFGDSFADTGNFVIIGGPTTLNLLITKPPYGMTFFGHPTGRISDGRLVIDFIGKLRFLLDELSLGIRFSCNHP